MEHISSYGGSAVKFLSNSRFIDCSSSDMHLIALGANSTCLSRLSCRGWPSACSTYSSVSSPNKYRILLPLVWYSCPLHCRDSCLASVNMTRACSTNSRQSDKMTWIDAERAQRVHHVELYQSISTRPFQNYFCFAAKSSTAFSLGPPQTSLPNPSVTLWPRFIHSRISKRHLSRYVLLFSPARVPGTFANDMAQCYLILISHASQRILCLNLDTYLGHIVVDPRYYQLWGFSIRTSVHLHWLRMWDWIRVYRIWMQIITTQNICELIWTVHKYRDEAEQFQCQNLFMTFIHVSQKVLVKTQCFYS